MLYYVSKGNVKEVNCRELVSFNVKIDTLTSFTSNKIVSNF